MILSGAFGDFETETMKPNFVTLVADAMKNKKANISDDGGGLNIVWSPRGYEYEYFETLRPHDDDLFAFAVLMAKAKELSERL